MLKCTASAPGPGFSPSGLLPTVDIWQSLRTSTGCLEKGCYSLDPAGRAGLLLRSQGLRVLWSEMAAAPPWSHGSGDASWFSRLRHGRVAWSSRWAAPLLSPLPVPSTYIQSTCSPGAPRMQWTLNTPAGSPSRPHTCPQPPQRGRQSHPVEGRPRLSSTQRTAPFHFCQSKSQSPKLSSPPAPSS